MSDSLYGRLMAYADGGEPISREDARFAADCIAELHGWAEATTDLAEAREALREATRHAREQAPGWEYPLPRTGTNSVNVPAGPLRIP